MAKIIDYGLIISLLVLIVSFWQRNSWPTDMPILPQIHTEPLQHKINRPAFDIEYHNEPFQIKPRYDYQLSGLVVSFRQHKPEYQGMLHNINKDYLNISDLCVVWGDSADPAILKYFKFSNGQFSCQYQTRNDQAWQAFNPNQLSNNHLLANDESIRDSLGKIQIGDQIQISGWLSNYINPRGIKRGTSVVY